MKADTGVGPWAQFDVGALDLVSVLFLALDGVDARRVGAQ